jgi:WhiB family redox-sensing transcriptional regulator
LRELTPILRPFARRQRWLSNSPPHDGALHEPEEESELATTESAFDQNNLDWQDIAACNEYDNVLFFGEEGESEIDKQAREAHAKSICQRCPVREPCLEFAMETNQKYGIWGGLTDKERASLKRRRARARRAS